MGKSTQETAGLLGRLAEADEDVDRIVVDDVGVGGGVTDRLRESPPKNKRGGISIVAFNGGAAARQPRKYANAISEAWLELAEEFIRGKISIENDPALISQLSSRRRIIQGDRTLRLETKNSYKSRTGISPDNADALAMTMIATRGGPRISWA
jgi:phage terminase large subunit